MRVYNNNRIAPMKTIHKIKQEFFFITMLSCMIFSVIASVNYWFEIQERNERNIQAIAIKQLEIQVQREKERPVEDYLEYYSVLPEKDIVKIWDDLYWDSNWIVKEPISRNYEEVLKCDKYDGQWFRYFSFFESKSTTSESELWLMDWAPWRWAWDTPEVPAECFVDSDIKVTTEAWDIKTLNVVSEIVRIIE